MRTEFLIRISLMLFMALAIDLYAFKAFHLLTKKYSARTRIWLNRLYWLPSLVITIGMGTTILLAFIPERDITAQYFTWLMGGMILLTVPKLVWGLFHLLEDLGLLIRKLNRKRSLPEPDGHPPISRSNFLTKTGAVLASLPFVGIAYGIGWGKYNFKVVSQELPFKGLPQAFDGFRIVQISDLHIGSFYGNHEPMQRAVEMINALEPDLILFTGDLVNHYAEEMDGWTGVFEKLQSTTGKYSILGNHDYGDYIKWKDPADKESNFQGILNHHRDIGFELLRNEHRLIQRGNDQLALVGLENWGKPPFPQYGDLQQATQNLKSDVFQILMTHDPTHWDEEVLSLSNANLTLSGHTHGMQFGIEIPGWKWSPASLRYKRWGGLYWEKDQCLYVNRGLGFIGFPGRVGMPPEITLLELRSV